MSKAENLRKKSNKRNFNTYYEMFNKKPSRQLAFAVFLYARRCELPIPEEVLEEITPYIENIHVKHIAQQYKQISKTAEKRGQHNRLLNFALEEDSIKKACERYQEEHPNDNTTADGYRKRLKRFLKEEILHFIEYATNDTWKYIDKRKLEDQTTTKMLKTYKEFILESDDYTQFD